MAPNCLVPNQHFSKVPGCISVILATYPTRGTTRPCKQTGLLNASSDELHLNWCDRLSFPNKPLRASRPLLSTPRPLHAAAAVTGICCSNMYISRSRACSSLVNILVNGSAKLTLVSTFTSLQTSAFRNCVTHCCRTSICRNFPVSPACLLVSA